MKEVELFTDGACSGNPGPGAGARSCASAAGKRSCPAESPSTTNNRMELTAAIEGLAALKERCRVTLCSDSRYLIDGIQKGWARAWKRNGWRKADKKPALNADLWDKLLTLLDLHEVRLIWVRGHQGHPENERCDRLAVAQSERFKQP